MFTKMAQKFYIALAGAALFFAASAHAFNAPLYRDVNAPGNNIHIIKADAGQQDVESFIKTMGEDAIGFLSDPALAYEQKEQKFRVLLDEHFNMKTIGRFTVATYWKKLTPEQREEYQQLFEDLIVSIYAAKFSDYQGQKFQLDGSYEISSKDYIVKSYIIPDTGKTIPVKWQVRHKNGGYKIIDVVIEDVSMAITKKSEFSSIIQRGGGDPEVLLDYLRQKTNTKS